MINKYYVESNPLSIENYSKKLIGKTFSDILNENFNNETTIIFDEQPEDTFKAIYICGVINKGYSAKKISQE